MKIVTAAQMRELDRRATEEYGVPSLLLMENAGIRTFAAVSRILEGVEGKSILVVSGKGNNGGDGFVIARHLQEAGANVTVALACDPEEVKGDARANLETVFRMGIPSLQIKDVSDIQRHLASCDLIVDALFGAGVKGEITGLPAAIIDAINVSGKTVISVDLPSGLNADTGEISGHCIIADETVTFALPKIGLVTYPGAKYVGRLTVGDIGIPSQLLDDPSLKIELLTDEIIRGLLPDREPDAHKGTFGHLLVLAGSVGMTGAACLASEAGARVGAGLVTLGCAWGLNDIFEVKLTEAMTVPLAETEARSLAPDAVGAVTALAKKCTAVAIGPGLGRHPDTDRFVQSVLPRLELPVVIDADALNALAGAKEIFVQLRAPAVITPHPGEMSRLLGTSSAEVQSDRLKVALDAAAKFGVVVVLKGARTVIASPDGRAFINPTGNAGMASGGMGDVLTGAIGGFLAQGLSPLDAAICGVYLHGLAGDLVADELGVAGLLASDLLLKLPVAIKSIVG
ncbi:MAG: NAD(P)H-hydrate dehydratase [Armatimonadota bacterium]|nr:NAD(P)H-hydrate dehydratase [Armatimonadota bacterium]